MTDLNRRDALRLLGVAPLAGMLEWKAPAVQRTAKLVAALHEDSATADAAAYAPKFFNAHEWKAALMVFLAFLLKGKQH